MLLLIVIFLVAMEVWRRQIGAAILLAGATYFPIRHMRFVGLVDQPF